VDLGVEESTRGKPLKGSLSKALSKALSQRLSLKGSLSKAFAASKGQNFSWKFQVGNNSSFPSIASPFEGTSGCF
jgi:hypothetical protein